MKTAVTSVLAALAVTATALSPVTVSAGERGGWGNNATSNYRNIKRNKFNNVRRYNHNRHAHNRNHRRYYGNYRGYRGYDAGDAAAAAIIGFAAGAIISGALSGPTYYGNGSAVVSPRSSPGVITYSGSLEPWSPGWYDWCDARFRSFNPQTGTYRGYDGRDHFCVPR